MNSRVIVAVGVVVVVVLVTAIVAGRRVSRSLDPAPVAVETSLEPAARPSPVAPPPRPMPSVSNVPEEAAAGKVSIEELAGFASLVSGSFPTRTDWSAFVSRADAVARKYLEKKGAWREPVDVRPLEEMGQEGWVARAQIKTVLSGKLAEKARAFSEFQKRVDALYSSGGETGVNVSPEVFKAIARDLVHFRSNAIYLEDRISKL